jgi:hypothetical protein
MACFLAVSVATISLGSTHPSAASDPPEGGPTAASKGNRLPEPGKLVARGKWVLDAEGKPVPPHSFTRGLQPSGLIFRRGILWSVGDQRSHYPGHLLRIDPGTARLIGKPMKLALPEPLPPGDPEFEEYAAIPNSDFEGLCLDPTREDTLYAITEDKVPWVAEIRIVEPKEPGKEPALTIVRLTRLRFPRNLSSWREDTNFRFEGIASANDGKTLYLAFERAQDDLPRFCRIATDALRGTGPVEPEEVALPLAGIGPRKDKERALLNVNDIQFLSRGGRSLLISVLRDQERLLVVDVERRTVERVLDLDLLAPGGTPIEWVSPEGLALDPVTDRLWIINDPDSMRANYRGRGEPEARGEFASYTPLLFELRLSDCLGPP